MNMTRRSPFLNVYPSQTVGDAAYIVGNAEGCDDLRTLLIKTQQFNRPVQGRAEVACTEGSMFTSNGKMVRVCMIRVDDYNIQKRLASPHAKPVEHDPEAIYPWEIVRIIKGEV